MPIFTTNEDISGYIKIRNANKKRVDHQGLKLELIGIIEILVNRSQSCEFISLAQEIIPPGYFIEDQSVEFIFSKLKKPHESYYGSTVICKYYIRATLNLGFYSSISKEEEFFVQLLNFEKIRSIETIKSSVKINLGRY